MGRIAWFVGGGNVANEEHLAQLKRGVKAWNEWRSANPKVRPDLSDANLNGAHLRGADLGAADLKEAQMGYTFFADDDLSSTKGLDAVHHRAASSIGIDTIYKSQGKIPLAFLRGCGVPENFITYMPSLVAEGAIQFYSCFISYSTKDQEFAERLYADFAPSVVLHLAAEVGGIGANRENPGRFFFANAAMGIHLIEGARKNKKRCIGLIVCRLSPLVFGFLRVPS